MKESYLVILFINCYSSSKYVFRLKMFDCQGYLKSKCLGYKKEIENNNKFKDIIVYVV